MEADSAPFGIIVVGRDGHIESCNRAAESMFGYAPGTLVTKSFTSLLPAPHRGAHELRMEWYDRNGVDPSRDPPADVTGLRKDGREFHMRLTLAARQRAGGFTAFVEDVTERRLVESCLLFVAQRGWMGDADQFLPALAAYLGETLDVEYAFVDELLPGGTRARTVGLYAAGEMVPDIEYDLEHTPCREVFDGRLCAFEREVQQLFPRDEMLVDMNVQGYAAIPLWDTSGNAIGIVALMDTKPLERPELATRILQIVAVRAAHELDQVRAERQQVLLSTAVHQANEAIVVTDPDGMIQFVNPAFENVTGYSAAEAVGSNPRLLKSGEHDEEFYTRMWETIAAGEPWSGRIVNVRSDGIPFRADLSISPVVDGSGTVISHVGIYRDLTRETELEARLVQAQKMEAVGTLAGGIAHDFNNLLQIMLGYVELARADSSAAPDVLRSLDQVETAGNRAIELVSQILTFSRRSEPRRLHLSVHVVVKEALKLLRASLPSTIQIRSAVESDLPTVEADPTEIHQVVMNLCTNAHQAMEGNGVLDVRLERCVVSAGPGGSGPALAPGEYVRLSVGDTGVGMNEATLARIFEPYYSTKQPGQGTGLGLATVHGIVESYGGIIEVESTPGTGSLFEVYLPSGSPGDSPAVAGAGATTDAAVEGDERILLVDDEPLVLDSVAQGLRRFGYGVETYRDPVEALRAFMSTPDRFDVVVSDQTMPGLTGRNLVREIHKIRPGKPVVICSGNSEEGNEGAILAVGARRFVRKPALAADLAAVVREVLAAGPSDARTREDLRSQHPPL